MRCLVNGTITRSIRNSSSRTNFQLESLELSVFRVCAQRNISSSRASRFTKGGNRTMFKETGSNRSPVQLRWVQSDPVTVKKSKFKGYCVPVRSKQEVSQRLEELVDDVDKGLRKASHPAMCAWKIASNSDSLKQDARGKLVVADQGFEDNGEGGAGLRLQGLLDRTKLVNVLVVVARWYGGTPLGPQRFRLISDVGAQSLRAAGFKTNLASGDQYVDFASAISGDSPAGHGKSGNGNKSEKKSNKKR